MKRLKLGEVVVEVDLKDIKNIHLSVYPPTGHVKVAAPSRMNLDVIRAYIISKLGWIRKQQSKFRAQQREAPRDYVARESHYFLGKRYLMKVTEKDAPPRVILKHGTIELQVRPRTSKAKKKVILQEWYREQLKIIIPPMIKDWEKRMKVRVEGFAIRRMKTKWGSCNAHAKTIMLNLELAKKPIRSIEYLVVHEMIHLLERRHNKKYIRLMNDFLPAWRSVQKELNQLPLPMH